MLVSFGEALLFWLKLGFISLGGPAGQIAIMHQELVERRRLIYMRYGQVSVVAGLLYGIKPAVTAIVLFAAHRIASARAL